MSNYTNINEKIESHLEELKRKHRELDTELEIKYNNQTLTEEVRRMKTMKLWFKDEIHRLEAELRTLSGE
jgi:hypothetical protein